MLTAAVPSVVAGHLTDHYRRLNIVMAGALVFGAGTALEAARLVYQRFLLDAH